MTLKEVEITRIDTSINKTEKRKDLVAIEKPLHIIINQKKYVTILCLPNNQKELAIGHLLSQGIITNLNEIEEISLKENEICKIKLKPEIDIKKRLALTKPFARLITSACGSADYWPIFKLADRLELSKIPQNWKINAKTLQNVVQQLNKLAKTFQKTGAVHIAALYENNGILSAYAEDIGRHNAIDKAIGMAALKEEKWQECILASSGRLTGDIVLKAARMQIPMVASMAAAISSGLEIATYTGITLIGFVRGKRFNIYTHPERISLEA
ncbi:MAG: formate dehydrogenase accessory sulfurtransferase FdhD [Candidatus Bathyarchaeia archaeon]